MITRSAFPKELNLRARLILFLLAISVSIGCGGGKLSRARAAELIKEAELVSGSTSISVPVGTGCFQVYMFTDTSEITLDEFLVKALQAQHEPGRPHTPPTKEARDAHGKGLLDFAFSEFAMSPELTPAIPPECESIRAWYMVDYYFSRDVMLQSRFISWDATLSKKAVAMGLPSDGSPIVTSINTFLGVTGLVEANEAITIVEFEHQWQPTEIGTKLGLENSAPVTGSAQFRKYDDGWRLGRR